MTPNWRQPRVLAVRGGHARDGITILELVIVFTIIAILVGLLFPAIQYALKLSRTSACDNHLRQLRLALDSYVDATRSHFPLPPVADRPSGWALEVLPFIEEANLYNTFDFRSNWMSPANQSAALNRPALFFCPVVPEADSTMPGVGVSHYLLRIDPKDRVRATRSRGWQVIHAVEGVTIPWCTSPEIPWASPTPKPAHPSAFDGLGH